MYRVLRLIAREYKATVRTKGFIIGIIIAPILMSGSFIVMKILENTGDTTDQKVAIVDYSGTLGQELMEQAEIHNTEEIYHETSGKKIRPAYLFEMVEPDTVDPVTQSLELSNQVRDGQLYAFIKIGPDVMHPGDDSARFQIAYHAKNAAMDDIPGWMRGIVNSHLRKLRLKDAGIDESTIDEALIWLNVEKMGLVDVDTETGDIQEAKESSEIEAILIPAFIMLLMFIMIMFGVSPQLTAVMEEKSQRIAEVLLGSVTPYELMMGKVLGGVAVSLTISIVYVVLLVIAGTYMGFIQNLPLHVIPWFFIYMLLAVFMFGAYASTLGALCAEPKDAQNLQFPSILPVMIPMFVMVPIASQPLTNFATWMSLIPPFTPTLMLIRLATPMPIPFWQPWVGLLGTLAFTLAVVWVGGRVFRIGILLQGKPPRLSDLVKWALRG